MNKKLRIVLSLILALTLVMGGVASAAAMAFYDVTTKTSYNDNMTDAEVEELIQVYKDGHNIAKVVSGGKLVNYNAYKAAVIPVILANLGKTNSEIAAILATKIPVIITALPEVVIDPPSGDITVDQVPYNINILKPNSIGTVWMEATYKNNTNYPVTNFSMKVLLKDTNTTRYLSNYDTVMPGETSPIFDTIGPSTQKLQDVEILTIDMRVELPNNKYLRIDYDAKLKRYEYKEYNY